MGQFRQDFVTSISNDFQIPQAVAVMWMMLKSNLPSQDKLDLLYEFDQIFGLKLSDISEENIPEEIQRLAQDREETRKKGDFVTSDKIRKQITDKGFLIEDLQEGFKIKKI